MKMILLMFLEDDAECVRHLLDQYRVVAYSELPMEGHGSGAPSGWYGEIAPYRSRLAFTLVPADQAADLMAGVQACEGCQDRRHPIRAVQLGVEAMTSSGAASGPGGAEPPSARA